MATFTIHPIVMGTKVFDKSMMTYQYGYGEPYTIPIYCWYLEGGDRKILVDTGEMSPIISEERKRGIGGNIYTFEEGLGRWGLKPEDIDIVIHTHLHNDHCENDAKCTNAKIYVHEKELEHLHDPPIRLGQHFLPLLMHLDRPLEHLVAVGYRVGGVAVLHQEVAIAAALADQVDQPQRLIHPPRVGMDKDGVVLVAFGAA